MQELSKHNETQIAYLIQLQNIDKKLNVIEEQRGNLPELVNKLSHEIQTLETQRENTQLRIEDHKKAIEHQETKQKEAKKNVSKYEKEQKEASNDQEYKLITKDLELEKLDVLLAQKRIKEHHNTIAKEEIKMQEISEELEKQKKILTEKKKTLDEIDTANQDKLVELEKKRIKVTKNIDLRFLSMYTERHENLKEEVVVNVVNEACNGCFVIVPSQTQLYIKEREKVIFCESCSRIFAYVEPPQEIKSNKKTNTRRKIATKK